MKEVVLPDGRVTQACIYTPHSLRATNARLLLDVGVDIRKVQDLLGHRQVTTTQIYDKRRLTKGVKSRPDDAVTPDEELKGPFVLEFLNLKDEYSERDLEEALIGHLETFLLESGNDFTFVGRQRRLRIGDQWFRVDLVFFHRRLRCLIIIDLKLGKFTHADAGQMHMYLNYAREHWTHPEENPPVGLILCDEKSDGSCITHWRTCPIKS